jgi:hypothetical protein
MRVFVGTMESGENDWENCKRAISEQKGVDFHHHVVSGLTEKDAHIALYNEWNLRKGEFDLFLKVDADTVLKHDRVVAAYVDLFKANSRLTGVQAWLHDYMTDGNIFGLTCIRNNVIVTTRRDGLYYDRVDSGHSDILRGDKLPEDLNPAGLHCHFASEPQAFRYGIHRSLKNQTDIRNRVYSAWKENGRDRLRGMALIGFKFSSECSSYNYSDHDFNQSFSRFSRDYDEAIKEI